MNVSIITMSMATIIMNMSIITMSMATIITNASIITMIVTTIIMNVNIITMIVATITIIGTVRDSFVVVEKSTTRSKTGPALTGLNLYFPSYTVRLVSFDKLKKNE
ncbi:hypothetical protein J1TS3_09510 [Siminovitchia fordii]|uniref:NADH dehydrogenase subunit 4L n=2 Tax=Siminovitchia fordii TaxID=254759 RepID=A0ABQ4K3T4_9BACI|nr:hypothetical protein J1TS3_09510 [Siminovitchia fordii]